MSLVILHPWELEKLETADRYQAHSCLGLLENKPQINADERRLIKSDEDPSLSIFSSIILEFLENDKLQRCSHKHKLIHKSNHESVDQYQTDSCMGLLKNKPQINADERRLIKSDEESCFLNRNLILSPHIFDMIYSSHNHCL